MKCSFIIANEIIENYSFLFRQQKSLELPQPKENNTHYDENDPNPSVQEYRFTKKVCTCQYNNDITQA